MDWIDVKNKLPEDETECLAKYVDGQEGESFFWNEDEGFDGHAEPVGLMVTHWKPKPE